MSESSKIIRFPLHNIGSAEPKLESKPEEIVDVNKIETLEEEPVKEEKTHTLNESELEKIKQTSFDSGLDQGRQENIAQNEEQSNRIAALLDDIKEKLQDLESMRQDHISQLSKEAATLSIEAAKKLMSEVSNIQEHRLLGFFEDVFEKIKSENNITIKIHKESAKLFEDKLQDKIATLRNSEQVKVEVCEQFTEGQCEIDWELGKARLDPNALLENFQDYTPKETTKIVEDGNQSLKNVDESDDIIANS